MGRNCGLKVIYILRRQKYLAFSSLTIPRSSIPKYCQTTLSWVEFSRTVCKVTLSTSIINIQKFVKFALGCLFMCRSLTNHSIFRFNKAILRLMYLNRDNQLFAVDTCKFLAGHCWKFLKDVFRQSNSRFTLS